MTFNFFGDDSETEIIPPPFSDEALALAFAEKYANELRYVAVWGRWLQYDGKKWTPDDTLVALDSARCVCREYADRASDNEKVRTAIASASTSAAVMRLARSDRQLAATVDQWDVEPFWLNTPDGVVNLRTGDISDHYPEYLLTKMTAVGPGGDCPLWHKVLDRITGRDVELQRYLARVFGYAITGATSEHALFFCYGNGANGKSVVLNTVSNIMGDYAKAAPIETFTVSKFERHPTDLAGLRGARLVTATETEEGRPWAEARIKALTGGDRISARFMRRDFFEFTPQFKLVIAGNHKPGLRSVDEAIRRRFNLIPFSVTIPTEERDPDLSEKLKAEWPGILSWIIAGCQEWQEIGLRPPQIVTQATAEYLDQQDNLTAWITEKCQTGPEYASGATTLFKSWSGWAQTAGVHPGTRTSLCDSLRARGFISGHTRTGTTFSGIRVTPQMAGDYD